MSDVAGRPVPADATGVTELRGAAGEPARVGFRRARSGEFVDAYPAGEHDLECFVEGRPVPTDLADAVQAALDADPRCRRVVLPVGEQDIPAIAWAEEAGFRYVVDVEVRSGGYSLLVVEPDWVLAQPQILSDIPLTH